MARVPYRIGQYTPLLALCNYRTQPARENRNRVENRSSTDFKTRIESGAKKPALRFEGPSSTVIFAPLSLRYVLKSVLVLGVHGREMLQYTYNYESQKGYRAAKTRPRR
jgi:hypothetical protein